MLHWIEASGGRGHRPLLDEDPEGALRRLSAQREPLYREVADGTIDVDELTPDQVVETFLSRRRGGAVRLRRSD